MENIIRETKNVMQTLEKRSEVPRSNLPDFEIICFEDAKAIKLGACWMNRGMDRKPALEIIPGRLPQVEKIRAWLVPVKNKKEKA